MGLTVGVGVGPCFGGGAGQQWSPVAELAPELWLDDLDPATITTALGKVSSWANQGTASGAYAQANAALRPALTGGRVTFARLSSTFLVGATVTPGASYSLWLVLQWTGAALANLDTVVNNGTLGANGFYSGCGGAAWYGAASRVAYNPVPAGPKIAAPTNDLEHWDVRWTGIKLQLRVNGGAWTEANSVAVGAPVGNLRIGAADALGTYGFEGIIRGAGFRSTQFADADLAKLRTWTQSKFGV